MVKNLAGLKAFCLENWTDASRVSMTVFRSVALWEFEGAVSKVVDWGKNLAALLVVATVGPMAFGTVALMVV